MRAAPTATIAALSFAAALTCSACSDSFYFDASGGQRDDGGGVANGAPVGADGATGLFSHCTTDPDCQLSNLHCDQFSGACVECASDTNCPASSPRCDSALHRCVNCGVSQDCKQAPQQQVCEPTTHSCIATCTDTSDNCPAAAPNCLDSIGHCVQCRSNMDCVGNGTKLECEPLTGRCTECDGDEQCPTNKPRCDRVHDLCVGCTSSADCPQGDGRTPLCDPSTYTCVPSR